MTVMEIVQMEMEQFLKVDLSKIDTTKSFCDHSSRNGVGQNDIDQELSSN